MKITQTFWNRKAALLLFSVVVLLSDGVAALRGQSADGFDPNANGPVRVVVVQPDGKILIGGDFTTLSPNGGAPVTRNHIARLNPDGALDIAFDPNAGGSYIPSVRSIAVQAGGKILVGGYFTSVGGQPRNNIARLDGITGLADSFDPSPSGGPYSTVVNSIALQSDGKILAGGRFDSIGGQTRNSMARLDPTTGLADSFDPNVVDDFISNGGAGTVDTIAVQGDRKILAGGFFTKVGGQGRNNIARVNPDGTLDTNLNPNANGTTYNDVFSIVLQPDGKILVGGSFLSIGGQARHHIARLDATTGLADSFDPNLTPLIYDPYVSSIAVQEDRKILAGGDFFDTDGTIGGQRRTGIARLDAETGLADLFNPNANGAVLSIVVQSDARILVGGGFTSIGGQPRNHIARLNASLPTPTPGCTDDTWTATSTNGAPSARHFHTAVWTGSEMIIWGGKFEIDGYGFDTGGRYNPTTDGWTSTSTTNAPTGRYSHTAVWTGKEMIIWGGTNYYPPVPNTGGRYNPITDTWTATSTTNAPTARTGHTAVWTGSEMIVWGGFDGSESSLTGGRYNPDIDAWTPVSTTNAPTGGTSVWTGTEMIVWGGVSGGRYNPNTDTWTPISTTNAPGGGISVWTGTEIIVWNGFSDGRYDPHTDTWNPVSTTNAPIQPQTAVWTGSEMITWGGFIEGPPTDLGIGGRYNPATDTWTPIRAINTPRRRFGYTTVWTGTNMILWGGDNIQQGFRDGWKYCAQAPTPPPTGGNGSFVIGDVDAVIGHTVYFWGSQWSSHNHLSQGAASSAFKGFANSVGGISPNCGGIWRSDPGNSSGPPSSVPAFITVIASSSITKSGPVITGNNKKIVVVRTDPGYGANPSHPGTGTVVSVTCQ